MTSSSFECPCISKSFCHFFVNFQKLLNSHLFVQFGLTRVWRTRAACFRDTCILRQNVFPDLNVQYEQIISPLQRRNEERHIVLVGLFLLLKLFVLKQPCSGCNSFILWSYRLKIFGMWVYYHKMLYHGSSRPSHVLDLISQGQIIEFRELSYPGCTFFIFWHGLMMFGM
jgi:hypothetical protein